MPDTSNISTAQKGMNTDSIDFQKDSQSYSFALNAALENESGDGLIIQNDASNVLATQFPAGMQVIGKIEIHEQNRIIYALVNPSTGASEIGEVQNCNFNDNTDDTLGVYGCENCLHSEQIPHTPLEQHVQTPYCTYHSLSSNTCLSFSIDHPVLLEYRITDCGINIYFTDNLNDMRFMYFKYTDGDIRKGLILDDRFKITIGLTTGDCPQPVYGTELDCNKIKYNSAHSIPCISEIEEISGGSLLEGVYQVMLAYADVEGNPLSQYGAATQPFSIFSRPIKVQTNLPTDKAIAITINGIDTRSLFQYYNVVIAETIDNFTSFKLAGTFPISKHRIIYTGDDKTIPVLTADDVLFRRPFYTTAGSITKSNNLLFFGEVSESSKPNLQRVANNVRVKWQTVAIPESVYSHPANGWKFRSFLRDEVYPIGLVFGKDSGEEFCAVTVPGRASISSDLDIISNNDVLADTSCNNITRNRRWQVYNTATVTDTPHQLTTNCNDLNCWESGEMSYWESIATYPNIPEVWGDLCGKPIRHHKFPDSCVSHIHDGLNDTKEYKDNNIVYPLGIKVDHQSVIDALDNAVTEGYLSQADRDSITWYRVVRGNRVGNKSIVAKGLLSNMWYYDKFNQRYYYSNYPYNDLRPDPFISNDVNTYDGGNNSNPVRNTYTNTNRYTFHSPDTHFTNPTLGTELHLETEEYGKSEGYFNEAQEEARYRLLSTFAMSFALAAGVAAALSSIKEKECVVYNIKSKSTEATLTGGEVLYSERPFLPFAKNNNLVDPTHPKLVESETHTTCRGSAYQLLGLSSNVVMLALFNFANQTIYEIIMAIKEIEIMKNLMMSLTQLKNFAIQYNSVGKYNNYKCVAKTGNKIRPIISKAYLTSENQVISENVSGTFDSAFINNWERESSVYLRLDGTNVLPATTVTDNSRGSMDDFGLGFDDLNKRVHRDIASYYASIKNFVPDQYGDIYSIDYLETNGCVFELSKDYTDCSHVFGGDTFINRFALKVKIPFFLQSRFRTIDEGDVKYSELGNVGYPNFYFNSHENILEKIEDEGILGAILNIRDLVGAPRTRLDAKKNNLFHQKGYIHLYNYGIPYFMVESDINVDLRHGEDTKEHDFYPHQSNLDFWLQRKNVDISYDNFYTYNKTYSKQNHESIICINSGSFDNRQCKVTHPNRVIYYDETNASKLTDNWTISKANNYYDFPLSYGKLISVDGIENAKVLVRLENGMQIFNAFDTLKTGAGVNIQLGTGGVFASRPQEFSNTPLGYGGSQHKAILHTEYGHITADAKRGQIFNLAPNAESLDEISRLGMKNWFKENLPFTLLKQFPTLQDQYLDNTFKGVGIAMAFDKRYNRFFITKRDYRRLNPNIIEDGGHFYLPNGSTVFQCNSGYTLVGDVCSKTTQVPAEQINTLPDFIPVARQAIEYAFKGTAIYDEGYNTDGTGVFTMIDNTTTNNFWANQPTSSLTGPVNRAGIWNSLGNEPFNEWVGVAKEIDVPETKIYYIGIAGDNTAKIKVGCDLILEFDPNAMASNHSDIISITFTKFHIYPVLLQAGKNYVELYGLNYGSIAVFAAEIYDNTRAEIMAANSLDDLNILFTTHDLIGEVINNFNYVCPDCQSPVRQEDGTYDCVIVDTQTPTAVTSRTEVFLTNPLYFCDKSWTASYNFYTKSWVAYHSFTPNFYIQHVDYFQSGINGANSSVWSHGVTNKSYQVYYGKLQPFIIETTSQPGLQQNFLKYVSFDLEAYRNHNEYDQAFNRAISFNKAIVYNQRQCSGLLELIPKDEENLEDVGRYPEVTQHSIKIDITNSNNIWNFNQFWDNVNSQVSNVPIWLYGCNNVTKNLNPRAFDFYGGEQTHALIRSQQTRVRLINDKESNYKMIFKLLINNQAQAFR